MVYIVYFLLFMFGASLGSFIGAQIWRENNSVKQKRSVCDGCQTQIPWYRLIPVFSSLGSALVKRSCDKCDYKLSFNYFFLEFVSGIFLPLLTLFLIEQNYLGNLFSGHTLLSAQIIISAISTYFLIYLAYEDFLYEAVSVGYVYTFITFSLSLMFLNIFLTYNFFAYMIALLLSLPFLATAFLSKERVLGLGDPLVLFSTLILFASFSPSALPSIFLYTIWSGAIISIVFLLVKYKKFERGVQVPFLPFLIIGILILLITNYYVLEVSDILYAWNVFFT